MGGGSSSGGTPASRAETQQALAAARIQGPLTAQGSMGQCTDHYFVWRDSDGTLHSWSGVTQETIDYGFKAGQRAFFRGSDSYLGVDVADFQSIAVYETNQVAALAASIPYAFAWGATNDGILRLEHPSDTTRLVRKWTPGGDVVASDVLTTQQPPIAFGADTLVIPASVTVPYPLYLVNANGGPTTSVVFDGSIGLTSALPTARGLFVSYARNGGGRALRWYRDNDDAQRLELGDELATLPNVFSESSANEHAFLVHTAFAGTGTLFYDSPFGVWSYDVDTGALAAVQLDVDPQRSFVPDTLCVMPGAGLLVYRDIQDSTGRIWAIPLDH